jgi:hypothetical protein
MVNQINELLEQQQMSGHQEQQPETGFFAVYDPVHHMALASVGFGEDLSNDLLLTHVTAPPRTIAWRDLSHFHPGGQPIIGMPLAELRRHYGFGRAVSRCGMQAITYSPVTEYVTTFILTNGRVTDVATASP